MKRKNVLKPLVAMTLMLATIGAHADNIVYKYLVMKEKSGTQTSLSVTNLELTFGDGNVYATCDDGSQTFTLSGLSSMFFSEKDLTQNNLLGDANDDGTVDVADYVAVGHYIKGTTPDNWNATNADVNGDGIVNVADYIGIVHIIISQNETNE